MTNIRPRRAWAAAATLVALAGIAGAADASVQNLVGVKRVTFTWQPASGQPSSYLVSWKLNGGPLQSYGVTVTNEISIPVVAGYQVQISVKAAGYDSTGAYRVGPGSPLSDVVNVLPAPAFPAIGQWMLRCASCPAIQSRPLGDASIVEAAATGLPTPWVVLGHAKLGGAETIVWHNPVTGELALWDWASLTPISSGVFTVTALRGVGAADLDEDGIEEFLVQRTDTGTVWAWSLTPSGFRRVAQLSAPLGALLTAARDFDRDGRVELLWHNPITGTIDLARFTTKPILGTGIGTVVSLVVPLVSRLWSALPATVEVASTGDYDGDRSPDVLFRYANGRLAILYLNRGAPDEWVSLPPAIDDVNRVVAASRSVDGAVGAEIALQHQPTGEISIVDPTVLSQAARTVVLTAGSKWELIGVN